MITAPSPQKCFAAVVIVCLGGFGAATAQSVPELENGRYALSPVADGVIRLDTRTGAVSTCNNSGAGWACYAVPDERAALDAREPTVTGKIDEPLPKQDSLKPATPKADAERKIEIPLPSDRDMDRVMSFLEQAWRRLIEMAQRVQKDFSGKI